MSTLGRIFYLNDKVIIIWEDPIAHLMLYELNYPQFQRLFVDTHVYLDTMLMFVKYFGVWPLFPK